MQTIFTLVRNTLVFEFPIFLNDKETQMETTIVVCSRGAMD